MPGSALGHTSPVLAEVDYFLGGLLRTFTRCSTRCGAAFRVEDLILADYERVSELLHAYADLKVGFVECAVRGHRAPREPKLATSITALLYDPASRSRGLELLPR